MASGEVRTGTVTTPGGDAGPVANAEQAAAAPEKSLPTSPGATEGHPDTTPDETVVVDRSAVVTTRTPGPFGPRQLARIDEALTLSSRETELSFSVKSASGIHASGDICFKTWMNGSSAR